MIGREYLEAILAVLGNLFAWFAHTEQIWFPVAAAYVRDLAPVYGLPDLRGPFAMLTLIYIGLRLGDWLNKRDEIKDTL